tara:strand:+ start:695 stop:1747 length:1053 start_codon:yes stop_codon:yes gene_type:complete
MKTLIELTPTIEWVNGKVRILDQTKLPLEEKFILTDNYNEVCKAIYRLSIRGAPALGVAGAYACVLASNKIMTNNLNDFIKEFLIIADKIIETRPTAVNLMWAINKVKKHTVDFSGTVSELKKSLLLLANKIKDDDIDRCHNLSLNGSQLITSNSNVMTICNTGGLATSGIGTALGVIQYAHAQGKNLKVHVCETRPLLQGARLNTWELKRTKTPFTLLTDNMAAQTLKNNKIDGIFVGADRIASNGDTANKIGTYSLAVLAKYHNVPFYVAAPLSTVDYEIKSGLEIPIEKRPLKEVTRIKEVQFTDEDFEVTTPAFDVTPAELISGIITEKGIAEFPFKKSLLKQNGN